MYGKEELKGARRLAEVTTVVISSRSRAAQISRKETVMNTPAAPGVDTRFCRFCRKPQTDTQTLFHPCRCKSFTHHNCLKNSIRSLNNAICPDCGHKFDFTIVYGDANFSYVDKGKLAIDTAKKAIPLIFFSLATVIYVIGSAYLWTLTIPFHFGKGDLLEGIFVFLSFVTSFRAVFHVLEIELPQWLSFQAFCGLTKVEPRGYGPILFKTEQFSPIIDWQRLSIRILNLLKLCMIQAGLFIAAAPVSAAVTRFFVVKLPQEAFSFGSNATSLGQSFLVLAFDEFLGHVALFAVFLVLCCMTVPHQKFTLWQLSVRFFKVVFCFLFVPWWTGFTTSILFAGYHGDADTYYTGLTRFYSYALIGYVYHWLELKLYKHCVAKVTEREAIDVAPEIDEAIFKPDFGTLKEFTMIMFALVLAPYVTFIMPCSYRHAIIKQVYGDAQNVGADEIVPSHWTVTALVILLLCLTYVSPVFDYVCIIARTLTKFRYINNPPNWLIEAIRGICFVHITAILFGILWTAPELLIRWFFDSSVVPSLSNGYIIFIVVLIIHNLINAKFFYQRYRKDLVNFFKMCAMLACTVIFIPTIIYFYFRIVFHRETVPRRPHIEDLFYFWYAGFFAWIALATNSLTFEKSVFVKLKEDFQNRKTSFSDFVRKMHPLISIVTAILVGSYGFENIIAPVIQKGGFHSSYHHLVFWIALFAWFYIVPCVLQCYEFARQKTRQVLSVAPKNFYNEV